ncbi:MAG TPA: AAA family ATPase [Stellaceae bacterium]|nr:AAA family ATPase [Stellaceae bacterium]
MVIDVGEWLRGLGLEQYAPAFRDNDIDGEVLPELTGEDLTGIGVASIGHRRKLLAAIAALREPPARSEAAPAPVAPRPADVPGAERRLLTIMFCDLVGSTELATRLDPEDLREVIGAYHRCAAAVLARFGGFVAKYMGDGVLAYFGYPQAHEEDAEQAVRAGLAIVDAVAGLGTGQRLELRLGIATGSVVVGDLLGAGAAQEQSVIGETPNLAARLQSLASANQIVIADATRRQIGSLFEVRDLGPQELKGFAGGTRAWQVIGESGVASRFEALRSRETPLVGREEELDLLLRRWRQARDGDGRVVLISAEPGIGKSRLTEALAERLGEPHLRLRYFCSPHHRDSALFPVIGQIEHAAGFVRDDTPAQKTAKLTALLGSAEASAELALFADLLSLPDAAAAVAALTPQQKKEKTFDALLAQMERLARRQPVLMVFEDLHWIDPTSLELLDRIIDRAEHLPVLVIATFRPEFQPRWVGQAQVTVLALSRLGRRDGAALVQRLAGNLTGLADDIVNEIIERTDGVPLFLEEVTKAILETAEAANTSAARGAVAAIPGARAAVPATLQASLMARLDRLGPAAREIAQTGAAIGREFSYELAVAVAPRGEPETRAALDQLVAAGLVFQRGTPPAAEYQFKHALVQDTAYGTLLRAPRQALHARIAAEIERRLPERVEREPEILAHHLTEAGELDGAATRWLEAGSRAAGRSANIEAVAHLTRGIAALSGLSETPERDRREMNMQLLRGPALMSNRGFGVPEVKDAYRRANELAGRLGDDRARFAATWGLWITAQGSSVEDENRLRFLGEMVEIAERIADPELTLQAHHSAWATRVWRGEFVRSQEHVRQGLALYDPAKHGHHALMYGGHDPGVCGKGQGAMSLWVLGYPDQAAQYADDAIALGEKLAHIPSTLHALWFAGTLRLLRREGAMARDCGERLLALGGAHGLKQYQALGGIIHGWALIQLGRPDEGRREFVVSIDQYGATARLMLDVFQTGLAEAETQAGNFDEAGAALAEAEAAGRGWWQAEFLRVRGEGERSFHDPRTAEQSYREAIAVAQDQSAKSLELRAATSLARLWLQQNRTAETRALLAPLYDWFTEGLDTADLRDAKALLDELA